MEEATKTMNERDLHGCLITMERSNIMVLVIAIEIRDATTIVMVVVLVD